MTKKIIVAISSHMVNPTMTVVVEVPEDSSPNDLAEIAQETVNQYVEWGWNYYDPESFLPPQGR